MLNEDPQRKYILKKQSRYIQHPYMQELTREIDRSQQTLGYRYK